MALIIAIESSCDETSVAVVRNGVDILSNVIASQIDVHKKFGGVVPEVASRKHLELINGVIEKALELSDTDFSSFDAVAVTNGPGLVGSLLVGVSAAKAMSFALDIPLIAVNHLEGHIYSNFLVDPYLDFPLICLVVSGGHTDLVFMSGHGNYQVVGRTRDDAAGEAFDKVARTMGLGYPGGPLIEKLAEDGENSAVPLPRAFLEEGSLDFSFSGLKSAVINYLHRSRQRGEVVNDADLAASFQQAVVDVLVDKTMRAVVDYQVSTVILAGGVAANTQLRTSMNNASDRQRIRMISPPPILCTDNAAMIACAAYYKFLRGDFSDLSLNAVPGLELV